MSTVDYLLLESTELWSLSNFQVLPFSEFSDRAPLFFSFVSQKLKSSTLLNMMNPSRKIRYFGMPQKSKYSYVT